MKPKRIQRKRTKGWKMPENTVSVTRPGKWGNPLKLVGDMIYIDAGHRRKHLDKWVFVCFGDIHKLIEIYKMIVSGVIYYHDYDIPIDIAHNDLIHWHIKFWDNNPEELRGKNLACFCKEGEPCHGDVLLERANR